MNKPPPAFEWVEVKKGKMEIMARKSTTKAVEEVEQAEIPTLDEMLEEVEVEEVEVVDESVETVTIDENHEVKAPDTVAEENAQLRAEMADMRKMFEGFFAGAQYTATTPTVAASGEEREIKVINLLNGGLILSTDGGPHGDKFKFTKQYEERLILESDLKQIVRNMPKTTQDGAYFIDDEQFVKENRLEKAYKRIHKSNELKNLFDKDSKEFMALFNNATETQKRVILSLIHEKLDEGTEVDANIIVKVGAYYGINLNDRIPFTEAPTN